MRVDHEEREIVCSVGDLVYEIDVPAHRRGAGGRVPADVDRAGHPHEARGACGRRRIRTTAPRCMSCIGRTCGGGTSRSPAASTGSPSTKRRKRVTIEEVKSIHFDLELEALSRSEKLQRHLYQLLLYSLLPVGAAGLRRLRLRAAARAHRPRLQRDEDRSTRSSIADVVVGTLERSLDALIDGARVGVARCAWRSARSPTRCTFPYDEMRPYQQEIVYAVAHAIEQREALLVSAPTGIGKTIAALYPAVKQALRSARSSSSSPRRRCSRMPRSKRCGCSTTARSACCASARNRRCARTRR